MTLFEAPIARVDGPADARFIDGMPANLAPANPTHTNLTSARRDNGPGRPAPPRQLRRPAPQLAAECRNTAAGDLARLDDVALVAAVGTGSVAGFAVLVDRHGGALYRVATRMLGDGHEAEDVVQECFARLWTHAARWQPSGAGLAGWLHRVTINLCFDRKRRFRVVTTPDLPDMADAAPLADERIEATQAQAQIAEALAALPERHRAALVLCYLQGFSNAEAAQMLDLHIKAMESLLFRARRQLREILTARAVPWRDLIVAGEAELDGRNGTRTW
jgi:RNA polymerase sigma-70 factor (ECF subfamily)